MIKASLEFHSPEHIYSFLKQQIGPLYMLIKNGIAIINFANPQHTSTALNRFKQFSLTGFPLQLTPYQQNENGQLKQRNNQEMIPQRPPPTEMKDIEIVPPKFSQFTNMIEEELQVKDKNDWVEVTTKRNKKEIIEFISSFNPILETAQTKAKELTEKYPENHAKIEEFQRFYQNRFMDFNKAVKQKLKNFRRSCVRFEQSENIDLEPNIIIQRNNERNKFRQGYQGSAFKTYLQYSCEQKYNQLKRLAALNDQHFVCTSTSKSASGKLLFFNIDDEMIELNIDISDGPYGLAVLEQHILVGTYQGYISFLRSPSFSQPQISNKLHKSLIFDIIPHSKGVHGNKILTIGNDNLLKLWSVNQQQYMEGEYTLFFNQELGIEQKNLFTAASLQDGNRIAYSHDRYLAIYNCIEKKKQTHILNKGIILKMAACNDNIIGLANQKYISFVDLRNNAQTQNIKINKECRTVTALSQFTVLYGCEDGQLGVLDRRNLSQKVWFNTTAHKSKIYDLCKMDKYLLSGDNSGQIVSWSEVL